MDWRFETVKVAVPPGNRRGLSGAYLNITSQGDSVLSLPEGTPEDAQKDGHIRGRSRRSMEYPG